jgi:hypothetical protein
MLEGTKANNCVSKEDGTKPGADIINTLSLEGMEMSYNHKPDRNFSNKL